MSVAESQLPAPSEPLRTRRALLIGAFGGVAGLLAGGLGRAEAARAAAGSPVIQGVLNNAGTSNTTLTTHSGGTSLSVQQTGTGTALRGNATSTDAIAGFFTSSNGPGFSAVTANRHKFGAYVANDADMLGSGSAIRIAGRQNHGAVATTSGPSSWAILAQAGWGAIWAASEGYVGIYGQTFSGDGGEAAGVYGYASSGIGPTSGVVGVVRSPDGTGVTGISEASTGTTYGVYGETLSPDGFGLYSQGNAHVNGTLTESAGSVTIDHPLDPGNKYLSHSFVESPDMLNVYSGTVVLDGDGEATVELPDWFEALNGDIRYQLTAVGSAAPDLHVKTRFDGGRFSIAGGRIGQEVSWQLTGIRQDAYAKEHPIVVEQLKSGADKGKYLHPELFGKPASKALHRVAPAPKVPKVPMPTLD
jgi:hypothetical protein